MKHRLLILGSLQEFVQLIELAKSRNIYTIVCDGYPDSPGKKCADKAYDIPPGDINRIVQVCKNDQVDGIITSFSDYLFECMVKIADRAHLKCYFSPEKLDLYRNKAVMKKMLDSLGIPNAKSVLLSRDDNDNKLKTLHFPVVTKPLDKYGSRGLLVLSSPDEIRTHFDYICETSECKKILAEEYNDGFEFNMMTWVLDGKIHVLSIADREKTPISPMEIPISTRNVYPSRFLPQVYDEARSILQRVAEYSGQKDGILSMQFFWKPGHPISVGEVAGRFLGYEHELIEYCSGLAVERLMLDYLYDEDALRNELDNHSPFFEKHSAVLYFHGKNGMTVQDQTQAMELAKQPYIQYSQFFYRPGERIVPHGPNPYVLRYYISADTRETLDNLSEYIFEHTSVRDAQDNSVIYQNKIPPYSKILSEENF